MSSGCKTHKDLNVWKESIMLAKSVYIFSAKLPADEKYGLTSQIRRAVVSIPSNIAEGAARTGAREFNHFLSIALGSIAEIETQIILAQEFGFCGEADSVEIVDKIGFIRSMLLGLIKYNQKKY